MNEKQLAFHSSFLLHPFFFILFILSILSVFYFRSFARLGFVGDAWLKGRQGLTPLPATIKRLRLKLWLTFRPSPTYSCLSRTAL
jgi:hypothetical protein